MKELTRAEIARINEIYREMGFDTYEKECEKTLKRIKRKTKQEFFTRDELALLYSFNEKYQGLLLA